MTTRLLSQEKHAPLWGLHWIDLWSLLLMMEKGCIRLDIAPESLIAQEEELNF